MLLVLTSNIALGQKNTPQSERIHRKKQILDKHKEILCSSQYNYKAITRYLSYPQKDDKAKKNDKPLKKYRYRYLEFCRIITETNSRITKDSKEGAQYFKNAITKNQYWLTKAKSNTNYSYIDRIIENADSLTNRYLQNDNQMPDKVYQRLFAMLTDGLDSTLVPSPISHATSPNTNNRYSKSWDTIVVNQVIILLGEKYNKEAADFTIEVFKEDLRDSSLKDEYLDCYNALKDYGRIYNEVNKLLKGQGKEVMKIGTQSRVALNLIEKIEGSNYWKNKDNYDWSYLYIDDYLMKILKLSKDYLNRKISSEDYKIYIDWLTKTF